MTRLRRKPVAVQALRNKKLDLGDGELRADMSRRILWTFNRMVRVGAVRKHGTGALATWTLHSSERCDLGDEPKVSHQMEG